MKEHRQNKPPPPPLKKPREMEESNSQVVGVKTPPNKSGGYSKPYLQKKHPEKRRKVEPPRN